MLQSPSPLTSAIRKLHMRGRYRRCARFFKNRCIEVSDYPPGFLAEAAGLELNLVRSLSPNTPVLETGLYPQTLSDFRRGWVGPILLTFTRKLSLSSSFFWGCLSGEMT